MFDASVRDEVGNSTRVYRKVLMGAWLGLMSMERKIFGVTESTVPFFAVVDLKVDSETVKKLLSYLSMSCCDGILRPRCSYKLPRL